MGPVISNISEEYVASIFSVERINELGTPMVFLLRVLQLLVAANAAPSSPILSTQKVYTTRSSETSILARPKRRYIPEGSILNSHRRENFKFFE
jgi:hypothetical protein